MEQKHNYIQINKDSDFSTDHADKNESAFILTQPCRSLLTIMELYSIEEYHILNFLKKEFSLSKEKTNILEFDKEDILNYLLRYGGFTVQKLKKLYHYFDKVGYLPLLVPNNIEEIDDNQRCDYKYVSVLKSFKYSFKTNLITVELGDGADLLFDITEDNETVCQIDLSLINKINNLEAIRIYEIYSAYKALKTNNCENLSFIIEINDFKGKLGIPEEIYCRNSDFKKRIMNPALETLNSFDIKLDFKFKKDAEKRTYIEIFSKY